MDNNNIKAVTLSHPGALLVVEPMDYPNPYDFTRLHRHDYFEVILVKVGAGSQLIDFTQYSMSAGQIFTVYPGQVHLMNRDTATGLLIQFRKDIFESMFPLKHFDLYHSQQGVSYDAAVFNHLYDLAEHLQIVLREKNLAALNRHKALNYLQIILISLIGPEVHKADSREQQDLVAHFLSLIAEHIYTHKKVGEYCAMLGCGDDKLNSACKTVLGKSALQLIHEEMLLEIKRLLLLGKQSLKEIAYSLHFGSQANFHAFVKTRTGLSPSELQTAVREIYN